MIPPILTKILCCHVVYSACFTYRSMCDWDFPLKDGIYLLVAHAPNKAFNSAADFAKGSASRGEQDSTVYKVCRLDPLYILEACRIDS
eukprot:jgi/Botrbrau1/2798/Bobra.0125s0010.1